MWKRMGLIGLSVVVLAVMPAAAQGLPRAETTDCWFNAPASAAIECYYVVVPENRNDASSDEIRLAVSVFRASGDAVQPDPVMVLSGGPGEKTAASAPQIAQAFATLAAGRDLIIFDQRGVGQSQPALECPEWEQAIFDNLSETDPEAVLISQFEALAACGTRLGEEGHDLNGYNTVQNAADVDAIRRALGYEQVNLVGVSYGSLLAQAVMRDHPEGVRSVVIDSVLPPDASFTVDTATTAFEALNRLLLACATDAACNTAYPDLEGVLYDLIDRLNADPVPVTLTNPATGQQYDSFLTGDAAVGNFVLFLYFAPFLPSIPQTIYDVADGDYALMTQLASAILPAYTALSRGMLFTVFCSEDLVGRQESELVDAYYALPPQLRGQADPEVALEYSLFRTCEDWPVTPVDTAFKQPVNSDIPTLVMAGEFDPVTPPGFAQRVAATLSNSYFYEFPAVGHSVNASSGCAQTISASFIADPTNRPDDSCFAGLGPIAFEVPAAEMAEAAPLILVEYTSADGSFTALAPESWSEVQPGVFARGETALDQTALVMLAVPVGLDDFLAASAAQLGLGTLPDPVGTVEANGLGWWLYELEFMNQPTLVAVTEANGSTYTVQLVAATVQDRDQLSAAVVLPILNAFTLAD